MGNFTIKIEGFTKPIEFINQWSESYDYPNDWKYTDNITLNTHNAESIRALLEWKNGTGNKISAKKSKLVYELIEKVENINDLKNDFDLLKFEKAFSPYLSASIWKIFVLHIIKPDNYPIFDQNVYRSYYYFQKGKIVDLPNNKHREVYQIYKSEYRPWFLDVKNTFKLQTRAIDKALFSFGRLLKNLNGLPILIANK